jgi:glycosyltransferase involved in cell wall biosynthesis
MSEAKQTLKIVVASDLYRPSRGGTETTTENLARGLVKLGHEVLVIAPGPSLSATKMVPDDEGQRILRVRSYPIFILPNLRLSLRPFKVISTYLDEFKPDIIQVNNHYAMGKALIRYGQKHNIPVVVGCHFMPESFVFNLRRVSKWLYETIRMAWWRHIARVDNNATAVIGPTETAVGYLKTAGLNIQTKAISNGIDLVANHPIDETIAAMRQELKLPERPTVLYIGRLSAEKQLDVLIEALAKAHPTLDAQLVFVGDGLARAFLAKTAQKLGVGDRVIFAGYLPKAEQKLDYLAAAELFAIPSTVELQSIVTLEAMACGKPITSVNEGALPELVHAGRNGETFAMRDSDGLAKIWEQLLPDKAKLDKYGAESLAIAQHHNINDMPQNYANFYRELLARA